ncbi:MAG: hypothetical protein M1338_01515 [Patescibacteria group bacterium]|nr:hypothetical protein [Patescibacteria group bacterium]
MGLIQFMLKNDTIARMMNNMPEKLVEKLAFKKALQTFKVSASKVPAYKEFLRANNINPNEIKTPNDFQKLPIMDKENYVTPNSLHQLVLGKVENFFTFGSSSGSTGRPLFWPSLREYDQVLPAIISRYYIDQWAIDKIPTLFLICFPMGAWVGSLKSAAISLEIARDRKYPFTVIVPGANLNDTKRLIQEFSPYYQQIVILSFPLFFRNLIDDKDINWKTLNIKYFGSGEFISEEWREYVRAKLGEATSELNGIVSLYSAGELGGGLIGFETIFTNLLRKLGKEDKKLAKDLFGDTKIPIIVQYTPMSYYLELVNKKIVITTQGAVPFVRYCIKDNGRILKFSEVTKILQKHKYDYKEVLKGYRWDWKQISSLPLLMIYGRADDTVIFNGVNIYHPSLEPILYHKLADNIHDYKLGIEFDREQKEKLVVNFELKKNIEISNKAITELESKLGHLVVEQLQKTNLDFADEYNINSKDTHPKIVIYSFGSGPFSEKKLKKRI